MTHLANAQDHCASSKQNLDCIKRSENRKAKQKKTKQKAKKINTKYNKSRIS